MKWKIYPAKHSGKVSLKMVAMTEFGKDSRLVQNFMVSIWHGLERFLSPDYGFRFIATRKRCNVTRPANLSQMEPCLKLHLSGFSEQNIFTGYGSGYVMVNRTRYERSLIILPDRIIENWEAGTFEELKAGHFEFLLPLQPEMVLLGTGATLRFPHPSVTKTLITSKIGVEVMDTNAVCRTYNILTAEGRRIAAALII